MQASLFAVNVRYDQVSHLARKIACTAQIHKMAVRKYGTTYNFAQCKVSPE